MLNLRQNKGIAAIFLAAVLLISLVPSAGLSAEEGNGGEETDPVSAAVNIQAVSLSETSLSKNPEDYFLLTASVFPAEADDSDLCWESSDTNVAEVYGSGSYADVYAKNAGNATVTVYSKSNPAVRAICVITVENIGVSSITLDQSGLDLTAGETADILASIAPENATDRSIEAESSDPEVAVIAMVHYNEIQVQAIGEGSAVITVSSVSNPDVTAACEIRVESSEEEEEEEPKEPALPLKNAAVKLSRTKYTYDGFYKYPDVTVSGNGRTYRENTDYSLAYRSNVNAGTASVVIRGKGSTLSGTVTKKFTILPAKITYFVTDDLQYNGSARAARVYASFHDGEDTYALKKGRDFKIVSGKLAKAIGYHRTKIKGIGNFTGTKTASWRIYPGKVRSFRGKTNRKKKTITVTWKKPNCPVTGYKVEYSNGKKWVTKYTKKRRFTVKKPKNTNTATVYVTAYKKAGGRKIQGYSQMYWNAFKPGVPKFSVQRGFGQYTLKFKNIGHYQIQTKVKGYNGQTIRRTYRYYTDNWYNYGFSSGTVIRVRVRAYEEDRNGNVLMGPWSKTKKIKVY